MSKDAGWLGEREGAQLEYKSAEALKHPETIVRAVVAMLNHRGGNVVVGVDDKGAPHGVADADGACDALQQRLVDAIEPRPLDRVEVVVERVQAVEAVVVHVKAKQGTLYAERRRSMYGFWMRAGATTRSLTLDEVRARLEGGDALVRAPWHTSLKRDEETTFVLQADAGAPLNADAIERVFDAESRHRLTRRRMGFTVVSQEDRLERARRGVRQIDSRGSLRWVKLDLRSGTMRFEGRGFLFWKPHPAFAGEPVIDPWALVEGTASFFWLLERYGEEADAQGPVNCELGIWRSQGLRLGPYRPGNLSWERPGAWQDAHDNTVIEHGNCLTWAEIRQNPDLAAHPFIAAVYEDFGYDPSVMPFWSAETRRFAF